MKRHETGRRKALPNTGNRRNAAGAISTSRFVLAIDRRDIRRAVNLFATVVDRPGPALPGSNQAVEAVLD